MTAAQRGGNGILSLVVEDKESLYQAYLPYIKNGGLFVATSVPYQLGDEVFLLLSLMDEPDKLPVAGKVVWVTPVGAQNGRPAGIGVQLSSEDATLVAKIETYLAGALNSGRKTNAL
ncbi:PilZ domain-containing protein [Marinobacterium arenosum]|uniref:PilZ domain-containing protein n=1 Tax=Marinobacterium arenosum TaxID=2862496 RepID=UPI001C93871D|nr:PilZ domain-containing protein [Marinobacterium arenosum]MBY4677184.1 PilZ domain-containing protein [Marinobacterium arenosum]